MAEGTLIEWARHPVTGLGATWNITTGCAIVSPGCTNCYAMKLAGTRLRNHPSRKGLTVQTKAGPVWNGEVRFNEQWLTQPLAWKKPHGVFVAAHGDLFAEGITDDQLDRIFAVMALCPQHIFYVLTKRPERMREYLESIRKRLAIAQSFSGPGAASLYRYMEARCRLQGDEKTARILVDAQLHVGYDWWDANAWPLPNVWLGVSVEDQKRADERIPILLDTPAAIRFISAEPLLGPIDFYKTSAAMPAEGHPWKNGPILQGIHWIVAGGESGANARPSHPDWFRSLRDQCSTAGVAFFFKQWGNWIPDFEMGFEREGTGYPSDHPEQSRFQTCVWDDEEKRWDSTNGSWCDADQWAIADDYWQPEQPMTRIGKKAAGNHLEGVQHLAFPEARS